ncbi:MAG: hypothetical protein PWQ67_1837 [Clostridia bacterium]|jgi:hypothetical protein|nr:hypothetical protein [Clostridia bacterium]MDN5323383.1 hypothetical protein [Clostridia bacterium]
MKKNILIFIILLSISFLILFFANFTVTKEKVLIIANTEKNTEKVLSVPDNKFILSFIHSVHHTPVYEYFEINQDNTLIMKEIRYYSLGVGMPFTDEGGIFSNENGEFVLKFNREFDKLFMRISPIPQHAIKIGDKIYPLLSFAEPEQQIKIVASEKWLFKKRNN